MKSYSSGKLNRVNVFVVAAQQEDDKAEWKQKLLTRRPTKGAESYVSGTGIAT